ncbi:MAG: glutamate--tRNA ligase [Bauldia sp.]|nr:glutamate--tRNA ligase [Bauldia sp.]
MPATVRFAPSPTGHIHVGNARTALFNWLFILREGGRFLLRFDDTDRERSREEYAEAIDRDLRWLGIAPHETFRQSERLDRYETAADRLRASGRLYACYETPEELDRKRKARLRRGLPPVYDRAALALTAEQKRALEAEGRRPHWRFLLETGGPPELAWDDLFRGRQRVDLASLSDPVLVREDGSFTYTLPSVVDDIDRAVSHVIRGDDHVTNTGVQIALFAALGAAPPVFGHHNLLLDASGEGLSKRSGAQSVASYRDAGYEALAVAILAVRTGTSDAAEPVADLAALAASFDPRRVSHGGARFDTAELDALNARILHGLPYDDAAPRLQAIGADGGEAFWLAVRGNCTRLRDAADWRRVVRGPVAASPAPPEDEPVIAAALAALPPEPWDRSTWGPWTDAVKAATGRKGRALFMPIRRALTGLDHGPELAALLPLIGRTDTQARLAASLRR